MNAPRSIRQDAGLAAMLAGVLGAVWTIQDRVALAALRLPDTDDVMRLQQVRDWIGGQAFADVSQHRLGTGLAMHWSRLADLAPAAGIEALAPLIGRHGAEVATVVAWPVMLFAAALFCIARIARALGAPAPTAALVAAIAYPSTTCFLPGRIDHHGLQVVLLLGAVLALVGAPTRGRGLAIGALAAASIAVGLETAPLFVAIGGACVVAWIVGRTGARTRIAGLAIGTGIGLAIARAIFASDAFAYPACDGFTLDAWRAATAASIVLLAMALAPTRTARGRALATATGGAAVAAFAIVVTPRCLSPYGAVDPLLARVWLAHVAEAQSPFAADPAAAIGYLGLSVAGLAATIYQVARTRAPAWLALLAIQAAAFAVTAVQLRGAYAGAMLAAPGLAAIIGAARRGGALRLTGAWLASAGMVYPIAAQALPLGRPAAAPPATAPRGDCLAPALLARLAALPPATVMAPMDVGAYAIATTPDRLVAAPYHRNGPGDLAMFRFYSGTPAQAAAIARRWHVGIVLACAGMPEGPMASAIDRGRVPWLVPVATMPDGARLLRVR